ncbi:MAG TPA: TetR/AcrR family transcriptional regulator C-terminal domain-containing protein [Chloroflexota bacterium]|nr:TetR/AcrR family transcriptional regulator C-terminal domain-containing protein [Chloroflexota bacterium]
MGTTTSRGAGKPAPSAADGPGRPRHSREEVLRAGLQLIDAQGLDGFTMRKLAQALGVDPMAIYNYVDDKGALLDGLVEVLWAEVDLGRDEAGWEDVLRSLARSVRALAHTHPRAYPLLVSRQVVPKSALRVCDLTSQRLERSGFDRTRAVEALRAVWAYALGQGMLELSVCVPENVNGPGEGSTPLERLRQVLCRIPADASPRLAEVACLVCDCDLDAQFALGLELILGGLKAWGEIGTPEAESSGS